MRNKKKTIKNKKVFNVLMQTLKEMLSSLKYGVIEELDKIALIIQIAVPVVIASFELNIVKMLVISCMLTIVVKYIKEVGYKLNHVTERGFPIPMSRFTNKDENGFIYVKEEETQEAILYLCDVEDYLKSKGWLK